MDMKEKNIIFLLIFGLLLSASVFAQNRPLHKYFEGTHTDFTKSPPKLLPTEVQNAYDVKWYFLNLNAENTSVALSGNVTIKAEVVYQVMDTFSFHLYQSYIIDSILINGVKKTFINNGDERLVTGLSIPKNTIFDAQIFYHGSYDGSGAFFSGISNAKDHRWGEFDVTWTLSQPNNAYHWFPVKQNLTDKADSCWVFVTTTKPNKVGSIGLLTNVVDLPNNKVRYEWKSRYPIDYYLISIAVAEYQDYPIYATLPQSGKQLLIQNYIYNSPQCLSQNKENIDDTKEMIEFFSEVYGEYPFNNEKYGHSLAPLSGAMEHQTMTTTGFFDGWLVAHELVHQWFGDNVTCASWQHIWLNEGFARYGEYLWWEYKYGREDAFSNYKTNIINNVANFGKNGSVFVPIEYIDDAWRIFNGTLSYNKGSTLVHMIRYELGDNDELFFNILRTYQNRFKNNVAISKDFQNVVEELSGKDFSTFFEQWLYGEGYPQFVIYWQQFNDKLILNSEQIPTASSITPLFKVTYEIEITYTDNSKEVVPFYHDEKNKYFTYSISNDKTVKSLSFDPNNWLLAKAQFRLGNSIDNFCENMSVTIYPNPATLKLYIKFDESLHGEKNISLYDVTGRTVLEKNIQPNHFSIALPVPAGNYFVALNCDGKVNYYKIVINP
jgi:aminopeptidase N